MPHRYGEKAEVSHDLMASIADGSIRDVADTAARMREWAVGHEA